MTEACAKLGFVNYIHRMKIRLLYISGKENKSAEIWCAEYEKRISRYQNFQSTRLKLSRNLPMSAAEESRLLLRNLNSNETLILLDERGKKFTSVQFAKWLEVSQAGNKGICFAIGGAYGFNEQVKEKADMLLSVSDFTLPHALARLVFTEQLYRAFTIIKNEPYHHSTTVNS
jgi:23S rRNA (pseudouridine1915-N3)-methyltransferase